MENRLSTIKFISALCLLIPLAGCASPFAADQGESWRGRGGGGDTAARQRLDPAVAYDAGRTAAEAGGTSGGAGGSEAGVLPEDAGLDDYVALALARNPAIRVAEHRIQRLGARVPQVTSLDDPMFQIAPFGDMAETAAGQVGLMTTVSQKLPFPGKLETRGRIAGQDAAMAVQDLRQTRLRIVAEVRRAYWSYYFTTRALETTGESRGFLDQFRQIAEAQYKAGERSQPDVLRAYVELGNLDGELITLGQRQATARAMLNTLMDRPLDAALSEPPAVKPRQPGELTLEIDALLQAAAANNPAIAKVRERIEQARQQRKLAKLNRWSDLTISATFNAVDDTGLSMAANGKDQWWLGFGVNLPIWFEKYQAAEREALEGMLESGAELEAQRNGVAFEVQEAYLKVQAQRRLVELFDTTIIPQARQTVEASSSGYRAGSVDFLTLMDNWRKQVNYQLMYHRALAEMEQALADLRRVVGE